MNSFKKITAAAVATGLMLASGFASAAIDISAETTAAKTDIAAAGLLIIGVCVACAAVGWVRRVIK